MHSNFKRIYAYKIVRYSRPIYKYDLDAMPMFLMRSLIDCRLNFKNFNERSAKRLLKAYSYLNAPRD